MTGPMLVAAVGNPDRGDDGVGWAVARRLCGRAPDGVRVLESGGDVLSLIQQWEGFGVVIFVDAAAAQGQPGRIHRFDLAAQPLPAAFARTSTHALGIAEAVELARQLGRLPAQAVAYLIEGQTFAVGAPLSPGVAAAVETAATRILGEISRLERSASHA